MRRLIPEGFLTVREAAQEIRAIMYGGISERPEVAETRQEGYDVTDGKQADAAFEAIWRAVDGGQAEPFLVAPNRTEAFRISPTMTRSIPLLRNPRGGDFSFLRPSRPEYGVLVKFFGPDLGNVSIVFRVRDIAKLKQHQLRARRRKAASGGQRTVGRPSHVSAIKAAIRELVDQGHWSLTRSLKDLATKVNRRISGSENISADTVGRALDELFYETNDPRFARVKRKQHPAKCDRAKCAI